jgi:hypothetical protein
MKVHEIYGEDQQCQCDYCRISALVAEGAPTDAAEDKLTLAVERAIVVFTLGAMTSIDGAPREYYGSTEFTVALASAIVRVVRGDG